VVPKIGPHGGLLKLFFSYTLMVFHLMMYSLLCVVFDIPCVFSIILLVDFKYMLVYLKKNLDIDRNMHSVIEPHISHVEIINSTLLIP
jgi:hypothetical protein